MAKLVKKKGRRKLSLIGFSIVFLFSSIILLVLSSLFTSTINTNLTIKIQKLNEEIATIQSENNTLNIEIQSLENKDRVFVIAEASNLDLNNSNVIAVMGE